MVFEIGEMLKREGVPESLEMIQRYKANDLLSFPPFFHLPSESNEKKKSVYLCVCVCSRDIDREVVCVCVLKRDRET